MLQNIKDAYNYLVNDWQMTGWKIRMIARADMFHAIIIQTIYTWWVFSLPKNWVPELEGQGPYGPRQFRIFCFFVYNIALLVNCAQFFNGLLLYGCVDQGIKEKDYSLQTIRFYVCCSFFLNIVNALKFAMLYIHLDYDLTFSLIMTLPEIIMHVVNIFVVIRFTFELSKITHFEDLSTWHIGKNGKIIFD